MAKTHAEFIKEISAVSPSVEVIGHYERATEAIQVRCKKCGYNWSRRADILLRGTGCPACTGKVVIPGQNDFASNCPELLSEWDIAKNTRVSPESVTKGSGKKVWWICSVCGYEWEAVIGNRVRGAGCPECKKKKLATNQQKRNVVEGVTDFLSVYPNLEQEWDYEKNKALNPKEYSAGSNVKVWWKCKACGYKWHTSISHRCRGNSGCPICAKQNIGAKLRSVALRKGKTSLADEYPELVKEWDYDKNIGITPENVVSQSEYRAWWKCSKCGYKWKTMVSYRSSGGGCPCCSGRAVWKGHNDLATIQPELCTEWLYSKNKKEPSEYTTGSSEKVWWKCKQCGYEYQMSIHARSARHRGCPVCANHKVVVGINDLLTKAPNLYAEWDFSQNEQNPLTISTGNTHKFWWICSKCGFNWQASVDNRYRGKGCPRCKRETAIQITHEYHLQGGENSLQKRFPNIAKDWDYNKNGTLTPKDVTPGTTKLFWWICPLCGNHYRESVYTKKNRLMGCPKCTKQLGTSVPEQIIVFYLKKYYPSIVNSYKPEWLNQSEIDVFIPELNIGIEYDGLNWHRNIDRDLAKDTLISENGITLIRVREEGCPELNSQSIKIPTGFIDQQYRYMYNVITTLFETLQKLSGRTFTYTVDIETDIYDILSLFKTRQKDKSLAYAKPELVEEWLYEKNGNLRPEFVNAHTAQKVWWKCKKCGYEWKTSISSRTSGFGCPNCANEVAWPGKNDLKTLYPDIASEWDYERNECDVPEKYLPKSGKAVWWKCKKCGYEWKMIIGRRVKGSKCPVCCKRKSCNGRTVLNIDTGTMYSSIAEASIDIGVGYGSISACCRGRQNTAGGYRWRYVETE